MTFNNGWYMLLGIMAVMFIAIFLYRKNHAKKTETKAQLVAAAIALGFAVIFEIIGVGTNLWHYTEGDWPVILWVVYMAVGFTGYQVIKLVSEKVE